MTAALKCSLMQEGGVTVDRPPQPGPLSAGATLQRL